MRLGFLKGKYKDSSLGRIYDTSVCQVKFRKPRILMSRNRTFDEDRELNFDHKRRIKTRLQGVVFRKTKVIGFRNIGVSNIEEVSEDSDWPEVEPAKSPESLVQERDSDWEQTWGRDQAYEEVWGTSIDIDPEAALYTDERVKPQLTYYDEKKLIKDVTPQWDSSLAPVEKRTKTGPRKKRSSQKPGKKPFIDYVVEYDREDKSKQPVYEVLEQESVPIIAPPSTREETPKSVSPKDRKRAYAFNEYGLALMESGQYERAMTYFVKAMDLDPNESTYNTNKKRCKQWMDYKSRKGG